MKQAFLPFFGLIFILNGCVFSATSIDEIKKSAEEKYQYFTTNKTMSKAFEAYEFLGESDCDDNFVYGYDTEDVYTTYDFYTRLCGDYLSDAGLVELLASKDIKTQLSDKDRYCLSNKCDDSHLYKGYYGYDKSYRWRDVEWLHNDDECILRRRSLLENKTITVWCAFDYHDYIPEHAKIGTHGNFLKLYKAYKKDINECEEKRENLEITSTEYDECIKSVENKIEKIVKSGILK